MVRVPQRLTLTTVGVLIALSATPAVGDAATTFGSQLRNAPDDGHCLMAMAPCTYVSFSHSSGANGGPVAGASPVSGVITKFRIRATRTSDGPATVRFRLANIAQASRDGAAATPVGSAGPTVSVAGTGQVEEFAARLPVGTGSHLALDTSTVDAVSTANANGLAYAFSPALRAGPGLRASAAATGELLVQATVEPDADHDGFGDQTQDRARPRLSTLTIKRGKVVFSLSEAARVSLRLERQDRQGRLRAIRRLRMSGRRGTNVARFAAKLRGGRYRLVLVATDRAGNRSKPLTSRPRDLSG